MLEIVYVIVILVLPLWVLHKIRPFSLKEKVFDSILYRGDNDYIEYVPEGYAQWEHTKRYCVIKGLIRKNGKHYIGWFVYDFLMDRYVLPDVWRNEFPLVKANNECEALNKYDQTYNDTVFDFVGVKNKVA